MFVGCPNLQTLQGVNATSDGKGWVKDGALEYVIPNVSDTYSIPSGITAIAWLQSFSGNSSQWSDRN